MVSFLGLAFIVAAVVAGVVIAVLAGSLFVGEADRRRCRRCGATIPANIEECTVCEAPFQDHGLALGDGQDAEEASSSIEVDTGSSDEEGWINPGITQGMIRGALAVMVLGLSVRFLGMLDPVGLNLGIPDAGMAALTVMGGIAAFVGFVVLDVA